MSERKVVLRDENDRTDSRSLVAYLEDGSLRIDGQDLGPGTAPVSPDGEYEWVITVAAGDLPRLAEHLGGSSGEDILDVLERSWCGERAAEAERLIMDDTVPHAFWSS